MSLKTNDQTEKLARRAPWSAVAAASAFGSDFTAAAPLPQSKAVCGIKVSRLTKTAERTGNVIENKRRTWKTRTIPRWLSTRRQRVNDELGQVNERAEGRQRKADG